MIIIYILLFFILFPIVLFLLFSMFLPMFLRAKFGKMAKNMRRDGGVSGDSPQSDDRQQDTVRFNSDKGGEYTSYEDIDDLIEDKP